MRRLNVKLTLWLAGIMLFSVVSVHFLHGYQIDRNAEFLHVQAQEAEKKGNTKEAIKQYNQYLKYRDDPTAYSSLSGLVVQVAKETDATRQDKIKAYTTLEAAIRRHPDLEDVRRRLVDYTMALGRWPEALEHIQYLVEQGKNDSGLEYKAARCLLANGEEDKALPKLYSLVGYDEATGEYKKEPTAGSKEVDAFETLAAIVGRRTEGLKRADEVMEQLVALNPDMAKAHLARSNYLAGTKRLEMSKEELDRAFELAPDDIDVLLTVASVAMSKQDFTRSQELLDKALALDPKRQDVYVRMAQLSVAQKHPKEAAEQLQLGLQQANEVNSILQLLVEIQFELRDLVAVEKTCAMMREKGTFVPEFIRYHEARVKLSQENYTEASREFEAIRGALNRSGFSNYVAQLDLLLSRCYEILGQPDRELAVCKRVLQAYPDQLGARLGEATSLQSLGRYKEADTTLRILMANVDRLDFVRGAILQYLISDQLSKPETDRDWSDVDVVSEMMFQDPQRSELDNLLLKTELAILKSDLDAAQKYLIAARNENPTDIRVWVSRAKLMLRNEEQAEDKSKESRIPALLDLAEKTCGDSLPLRVERAREIVRTYVPQLPRDGGKAPPEALAAVAKLEADLDEVIIDPVTRKPVLESDGKTPRRKISKAKDLTSLMSTVGTTYLQLRDFENARRCWKRLAELEPSNCHVRQTLFELTVDLKDIEGMDPIIKELHDSKYFGPDDSLHNYCLALRTMAPVINQHKAGPLSQEDRTTIAESRRIIEETISERPEWSVLWRVKAEIDQIEGKPTDAIKDYQRSLDFSHMNQNATARQLVKLLYGSRRYSEAREAMKIVGTIGPTDPLAQVKEDLDFRQGKESNNDENIEAALAAARDGVKADAKNPMRYVWYATLLDRAGRPKEAEKVLRQAVKLPDGAKKPEVWDALVRHLLGDKKKAEAVDAVRQASGPLADNLIAVAVLYERVADQTQAEAYFKKAVEEHPKELRSLQAMAKYYLRNGRGAAANEFLDQIIQSTEKQTAESKEKDTSDLAMLFWARRYRAQNLVMPHSATEPPDYEQVTAATKMIEKNIFEGQLSSEDIRILVAMLANRPEPDSREKAKQLLLQLKARNFMTAREQLALGQLQDREGNWDEARKTMVDSVTRNPDDPEMLVTMAKTMMVHEDYDAAAGWVERLESVLSKSLYPGADQYKASARELNARMMVKQGKSEEAVHLLEALVPNPLPPNQLFMLEKVSNLLEELGQFESAEKLLNEYVSLEPRGTIAMAAFLGRRGDVNKAFEMLSEARKSQPAVEILPVALDSLRRHPDKATKERYAMVESWTQDALKSESNVEQIQLLAAELYDLEGRYPEVIKLYRALLESSKANGHQKAVVKNNLAFVLAITQGGKEKSSEAVAMADDAIRVLGPNSDLLDTRALGYLAQGDVKRALVDLHAATADTPSANKYFHLAEAEKRANNLVEARKALSKTEELKLDLNRLTPLERDNYHRLVEELK